MAAAQPVDPVAPGRVATGSAGRETARLPRSVHPARHRPSMPPGSHRCSHRCARTRPLAETRSRRRGLTARPCRLLSAAGRSDARAAGWVDSCSARSADTGCRGCDRTLPPRCRSEPTRECSRPSAEGAGRSRSDRTGDRGARGPTLSGRGAGGPDPPPGPAPARLLPLLHPGQLALEPTPGLEPAQRENAGIDGRRHRAAGLVPV